MTSEFNLPYSSARLLSAKSILGLGFEPSGYTWGFLSIPSLRPIINYSSEECNNFSTQVIR